MRRPRSRPGRQARALPASLPGLVLASRASTSEAGRATMRVAALYDVHGNLPALEAVLAEVDADRIVVGGDVVAGPWPAETLERLRALGDPGSFFRGNAGRGGIPAPKPATEGGPATEAME